MQPRVSKRDRKLHLSYQLPHRIHAADIYPITAPNGSTVIIYGHEKGLRLLWRGGRRRRQNSTYAQRTNGETIDLISDDEDAPSAQQASKRSDEYEEEGEEQDPDCPYPGIIADLDIEFGSGEKAVAALHIVTPAVTPTAVLPSIFKRNAIIAVSLSDGKTLILQIPLAPPREDVKEQLIKDISTTTIELASKGPIPSDLAIKYIAAKHDEHAVLNSQGLAVDGHLLIASAARALSIFSIDIAEDALVKSEEALLRRVPLPAQAANMSFQTSPRSAQLLLSDTSGAVRIYDPHGVNTPRRRPDSSDSTRTAPTSGTPTGKWIMAFHAPFHAPKDTPDSNAALNRRKKILAAKWIVNGKAILVLLEDGEWGIWHLDGNQPNKRVEEFMFSGFLGAANLHEAAEPRNPRKASSKLAPMTPNTRKAKAEQLFSGAPKSQDAVPHGGISVSSYSVRNGSDESAVLWYNSDVYSITSIGPFWQRVTKDDGGLGSLYSPGLSHVPGIKLSNEDITSIRHFAAKNSSAGIGQMNTQRDLLISTEHQAIILQSTRAPTPSRALFQQAAEKSTTNDQQMLDSGTLGIDGIDRVMDSMTAAGPAPTRKVGFAH